MCVPSTAGQYTEPCFHQRTIELVCLHPFLINGPAFSTTQSRCDGGVSSFNYIVFTSLQSVAMEVILTIIHLCYDVSG